MSAPISDKPGRKRKHGKWRWVASEPARRAGYTPRTLPLPDDESRHGEICRRMWAEMLAWLGDRGSRAPLYDGTINSLSDIYQRSDASPFRSVEAKTQRQYAYSLSKICEAVGQRRADHLTGDDFRRWHAKWAERGLRTAQERIKLVRIIMNYGAEQRLAGCATAADILSRIDFKIPKKRNKWLERHHVEAIIEAALASNRFVSRSIALCQAIQFETTLRQTDVIGKWRPRPRALDIQPGMIVTPYAYWSDGLTFERLADGRIVGSSNKEDESYDYNIALMPLTSRVLSLYSDRERKGPIAADEPGNPMSEDHFRKTWRKIANAAGVPKELWNRDSRSGGITEATDAGVALEDARHLAGHKQSATTAGYSRGKTQKVERAMHLRLAAAQGENVIGTGIGTGSVPAKKVER